MSKQAPQEELMIRYLLGELSEADRINFEQACLEDDRTFEELLAVEVELTDDYTRGALTEIRREKFEKRFLRSPARRDELELSRLIVQPDAPQSNASSVAPKSSSWLKALIAASPFNNLNHRRLQFASAALLIVLASVGVWTLRLRSGMRSQSEESAAVRQPADVLSPQASVQTAQNNAPGLTPDAEQNRSTTSTDRRPPAPVKSPTAAHNAPHRESPPQTRAPRAFVPTFALISGFERGEGGVNEVNVPRGVDRVQFKIELTPSEYQTYRAVLKRIAGQEILTRSNLQPQPTKLGQTLIIELPASNLPTGDCLLTISGTGAFGREETLGTYFVRIAKP